MLVIEVDGGQHAEARAYDSGATTSCAEWSGLPNPAVLEQRGARKHGWRLAGNCCGTQPHWLVRRHPPSQPSPTRGEGARPVGGTGCVLSPFPHISTSSPTSSPPRVVRSAVGRSIASASSHRATPPAHSGNWVTGRRSASRRRSARSVRHPQPRPRRHPGIGRSTFGALFGGIVAAEVFKAFKRRVRVDRRRLRRAAQRRPDLGRIGCFLAGLADMTYGTPTTLPWGRDFGDGIGRHPVQLYESPAMLVFLGWFLAWLRRAPQSSPRSASICSSPGRGPALPAGSSPSPTRRSRPLTMFRSAASPLLLYAARHADASPGASRAARA